MSNVPPDSGPAERPAQTGSEQMAAILAASGQPQAAGSQDNRPTQQPPQPQAAAGRTREQTLDDSENIDPGGGSDVLQAILDTAGYGPGGRGEGNADPRTSAAQRTGQVAGAITAMGVGATAVNKAFTGLTNRTLRLNESLAEWNGEIATATGLARARQIERQIYQGQEIGTEYARLDESQQDYRDMMTEISAPFQAAGINVMASLSELRNFVLGSFAPWLTGIAEVAKEVSEWLPGGGDDDDTKMVGARAFLSDLSDGKFDGIGTSYMNPGNRPLMSDADRARIFGP